MSATSPRVLDRRTLNRTLLARQGLLERASRPAREVVESLVGLQAQEPGDPYIALWSRIAEFDGAELSGLLEGRRAVRTGLLRGTLHLVTADDARRIIPITADVARRSWQSSSFAKRLAGVDIEAVVAAARAAVDARPQTPAELGTTLASGWPDRDPTALAYSARFLLPLVQVPPRGLWRRTGRATNTTAEAWLGTPLDAAASREDLVRRYLAAFGPATPGDARTWSWLTGLREVFERLRPILVTYRDEAGRELFDIAGAAIADPDLEAPVRFLPQYDNVFLSHEDRSRIAGVGWDLAAFTGKGCYLVDGFIAGAWRLRRAGRVATLTIQPLTRLVPSARIAVEAEAERLLTFLVDDHPDHRLEVASDLG